MPCESHSYIFVFVNHKRLLYKGQHFATERIFAVIYGRAYKSRPYKKSRSYSEPSFFYKVQGYYSMWLCQGANNIPFTVGVALAATHPQILFSPCHLLKGACGWRPAPSLREPQITLRSSCKIVIIQK